MARSLAVVIVLAACGEPRERIVVVAYDPATLEGDVTAIRADAEFIVAAGGRHGRQSAEARPEVAALARHEIVEKAPRPIREAVSRLVAF